jgi:ankyrin repeat protein
MRDLPTVVSAIQKGDVETLRQQLAQDPGLAAARVVDDRGVGRTLLHIATDWPGHFPNGAQIVARLIAAGADVNAAPETPLHWAASSNDVAVLDALLDGGANIEAPGAVITGGTAMWRGAKTTIWQAAALGLIDRVKQHCASQPPPSSDEITNAFWNACRGGQREVAEYLLERGANLNWIGHDRKTPLKVAEESGALDLIQWLRQRIGS